jgi:hypothetical protein
MIRALLLGLLLAGCDHDPPRVWPVLDGGPGVLRAAGITGVHLASCDDSACGNGANPPLGGDHCSSTLPCRKYDTAESRCSWIHNLEHGHAVLAYNCPSGCPELVAKLNALWEAQQPNPSRKRILVTPDPKLPFKMAAIVWGFGWQGDEFDEAAVNNVLAQQDKEAPEAFLSCTP